MPLQALDRGFIHFFRKISVPLARFGLFVIFFWFGMLKVLGMSPATPLVEQLFKETIPFMTFASFNIMFGAFEALIGVMFLKRGLERIVIPLLFVHMITTFMPLFLLPSVTWSGFLVPTMEGQYIIKNLVIIAAAVTIAAHLHPIKKRS